MTDPTEAPDLATTTAGADDAPDTAIDVWAQITTERMARAPWMSTLLRWIGHTGSEPPLPDVESTIASMEVAGVSLALLSAWYGPTGPLISNEELLAQIDSAPTRFRGLASVDLREPMQAVRTIRDLAGDDRIVGVRVVPWLWELPPDHRLYYPVYAQCVESGLPLCTQIGHTGPLRTSEVGRLIPYLENVLLDFPELVVVGGHVGYPWIDELTSLTFKFPNLYVDTSAYALSRLPASFIDYLHGAGAGRVMFGTNWPMLLPRRCLEGLDSLGLDDASRHAFLSGTASKVFGV